MHIFLLFFPPQHDIEVRFAKKLAGEQAQAYKHAANTPFCSQRGNPQCMVERVP